MAAGYTHYHFHNRSISEYTQGKIESYLHPLEHEINNLFTDEKFLTSLVTILENPALEVEWVKRSLELSQRPYTIFAYKNKKLVFWSNDKSKVPDPDEFSFSQLYYEVGNHIYRTVSKPLLIARDEYTFIGSIPIRHGNTKQNAFTHISSGIPSEISIGHTGDRQIHTLDGQSFLSVESNNIRKLYKKEVSILLWLYGLGILSLAILIQKIAYLIKDRINLWSAIGFFLFTAIGLRWISSIFNFTHQFASDPTFDPTLTQPAFSSSLGDLLINSVLCLWISIFLINNINFDKSPKPNIWKQTGFALGGYFLIFSSLVAFSQYCEKIIKKTGIDFNFESVFNLDRISIYALIGIILLLFTLFIWSAKIISLVQQFEVPVYHKIGAGLVALFVTLPIVNHLSPTLPILQFGLVSGIFILLLDVFLEVRSPNFTWVVLWLVVLSGFSSILLFKYNQDKDIGIRVKIAQTLAEKKDTVALDEFSVIFEKIQNQIQLSEPQGDIKGLILREFLTNTSYLSTYYQISFPEILSSNDQEQQSYNGLNYYTYQDKLDHYMIPFMGPDERRVLIYFQKKQSNPHRLLPSLLPIKNFKGIQLLDDYDYAVYKNKRCIERSTSEYNMVLEEPIPEPGKFQIAYTSGRSELTYNNGGYSIIIGRKLAGLIKPVSLFSYLFVIIVIIIFLLLILNSIFPYLPPEFNFTLSNQISLRNKIQVSVLALIILSFIIIGIVTVFYFQDTAEKSNLDRLKQTASSLQHELVQLVNNQPRSGVDSILQITIPNLAVKYNSHIQYYDPFGLLKGTSDPEALNANFVSNRMDIAPLIHLKKFGESIIIHANAIQYVPASQCAYFSLINSQDRLIGFVGLPVYPSVSDASSRVKDFMGTLLNVYVFLLLIAGAFALAVANSITRPMAVLGQKLKEFKLGKSNEPLEWKTKDELGELIKEYNQMIVKLDESADLLAQTEREVAWREMAKQVAHEIKNPLTPMKLSIQHLQHAIPNADPMESKQLVHRVAVTLIEQIDNLSKIAAEFSTFAKMPKPQYEKIILNDLVASVHDLFKKRDDMDFNLYVPIDEIYVYADKSHLLRVLNNLIKNAIQAIPASRRGIIDIKLDKGNDRAIIQVQDNGKGITKEMRDKVFYPNFTTKTSGTGLGLAISKNIVESFGGKIYFKTEENVGTKFFFELPLLKTEEVSYPAYRIEM